MIKLGQRYYLPIKSGHRGKTVVKIVDRTGDLGEYECEIVAPEEKAGTRLYLSSRFLNLCCWKAYEE